MFELVIAEKPLRN